MTRGLALLLLACCSDGQVAFTNGWWFDGRSFARKTAYVVGANLTFHRPARLESNVDLGGGYVVPPFGDAHNHNVEPLNKIDALVARYLRHGILYVKNPNCLPGTREELAGKVNTPDSIDVVFSNGGLTGSGGHPMEIVKRNIDRGIWTAAEGEGQFYLTVDTPEELDAKWPRLLATKLDFIKTYLLYSEEYFARKDDPAFFGWKGLNPALLTAIVQKAHEAGLRVSTHIETAADFRAALIAGVDEINHMPGFRISSDVQTHPISSFEITEEDARDAARRGTYVVTTLAGGHTMADRPEQDRLNARNLKLLQAHGVKLAIGSDDYRNDTVPEAVYLASLHVLDNRTLLKMWSETTARTIFPRRKVGELREGYEANFIVLEGDPLREFSKVTKVKLRVKQGRMLAVSPE
jgi:hypothetical protein